MFLVVIHLKQKGLNWTQWFSGDADKPHQAIHHLGLKQLSSLK